MESETSTISESDVVIDFDKIEGKKGSSMDLARHNNTPTKIESSEVMQVPSKFTAKDSEGNHLKQTCLKVSSVVIETYMGDDGSIEFRASELFNLLQDDKGKLTGFPTGEKSNLGKFLRDLGLKENEIDELSLKGVMDFLVDKTVVVKAYDKETESGTRTYLKFKY